MVTTAMGRDLLGCGAHPLDPGPRAAGVPVVRPRGAGTPDAALSDLGRTAGEGGPGDREDDGRAVRGPYGLRHANFRADPDVPMVTEAVHPPRP